MRGGLCGLLKTHNRGKAPAAAVKLTIWHDKEIVSSKEVFQEAKADTPSAGSFAFSESCRDILDGQDVSRAFMPLAATDSIDLRNAETIHGALIGRTHVTYKQLQRLGAELKLEPTKIYSPLVDLLKLLIVYRFGGMYLDINAGDLSRLEFDIEPDQLVFLRGRARAKLDQLVVDDTRSLSLEDADVSGRADRPISPPGTPGETFLK